MTDPANREQIIRATLASLGFELQRHPRTIHYVAMDRRAELGLPGSLQPIVGPLEAIATLLNLKPSGASREIQSRGESAAKDVHWSDRNKMTE